MIHSANCKLSDDSYPMSHIIWLIENKYLKKNNNKKKYFCNDYVIKL